MKLFASLFLSLLAIFVVHGHAEDVLKTTAKWNLSRPAYGQMKLVFVGTIPEGEVARSFETKDWKGPWEKKQEFQVRFEYTKGRHLTPKPEYDFVNPLVMIDAFSPGSSESFGTGVRLFTGPSTPSDIKILLVPIEGTPELEKPYKVAEISSPKSALKWEISVRFTEKKPSYINRAEASAKHFIW